MTIEEAIKVLRTESGDVSCNTVGVARWMEAIDMAISALRQQETVTKCNELNEPLKEFAEDVARQFAYRVKTIDGHAAYSTGGLSTLEAAFDILGWDEPHPCPECECEADGCHEWATCGTPTKDGYKWLCGKHFKDVQEESDHA